MESLSTAELLQASKAEILQIWEAQVREKIQAAQAESYTSLRNSIPEFLDDLVMALKLGMKEVRPEIIRFAHHHGAERANQSNFSIEDSLAEYNILRKVIFTVLERNSTLSALERDIIYEGVNIGLAKAGAEFVKQQFEQQKIIEYRLRESEARFREIANALPQIIWTATSDFHVDWYNDWWYTYLNLPRGTRWDEPETSPMHPEDVAITRVRLLESVTTGKNFEMEQRFRRGSDGEYRWHLVRGRPIRDEKGKITKWVGANTDIHDLKVIQKILEEETHLRDRFVSTLTHDLRTPLTAAKMSAEMIKRKFTEGPVQLNSLRIIENLNRANSMIENLLDASKIRAGKSMSVDAQEINLFEVVTKTLENLSTIHGDRFKLISPPEVITYLSPNGVRRVLENLCNNAIKYGAPLEPVTIFIERGEKRIGLCVHNKGNPLQDTDKNKLFEFFQQGPGTEFSEKGWGIGLTVVKGITEAHGGEVGIQSTQDGTTFSVRFPVDFRNLSRRENRQSYSENRPHS